MTKRIIINADDLGLSDTVNAAVVELALRERINSTSFMSFGRISRSDVLSLDASHIAVGLHWDATSSLLPSPSSLSRIISLSSLRLNSSDVTASLTAQLDAFEKTWSRPPAFIDGHQHVHQLGSFRSALASVWSARYGSDAPLRLRVTRPVSTSSDRKSRIIHALGGSALERQFADSFLNSSFSGVYDFDASLPRLRALWSSWLAAAPSDGHLIMCHPSNGLVIGDAIAPARDLEFLWLRSDEFGALLQAHDVDLEFFLR